MEYTKKRKKNKALNKNEQGELCFSRLLKKCLFFTLIFAIICIALTLILSLVFYNTSDPTSKISLISLICLYLSAFISSFILSKTLPFANVLGGLLLGAMIFTVILLGSFLVDGESNILLRAFIPLVTVIGSFLGIKRSDGKRKKHKKHY